LRLKRPQGVVSIRLTVTAVIGRLFELPRLRLVVMIFHASVEFARDPSDGGLVTDIGCTESPTGQPSQVTTGLDQDDGLPHSPYLNRRHNATGRAAVDNDVNGDSFANGGNGGQTKGKRQITDTHEPTPRTRYLDSWHQRFGSQPNDNYSTGSDGMGGWTAADWAMPFTS
jgi:hypothetical protein